MSLPAGTEAFMFHRSPMRLVQQLLCVEGDHAQAQTTLHPGDVGVDPEGKVEAAALIELVAQSYAAAQGYRDHLTGKSAMPGYLVGVSDFRIERLPSAGQQLLIEIKSSRSFADFYSVEGRVLCEGRVVAAGTLKVWVQPDTKQQVK